VAAKRLELLRELVPGATRVALLINPANAAIAESTLRDVEAAARTKGLQIQVLKADTIHEIMRPSPPLYASGPTPFSPAAAPFSALGESNWPNWRHATRSPRSMGGVNMSKSAG
jgi:hypothetical protein